MVSHPGVSQGVTRPSGSSELRRTGPSSYIPPKAHYRAKAAHQQNARWTFDPASSFAGLPASENTPVHALPLTMATVDEEQLEEEEEDGAEEEEETRLRASSSSGS